MTYSNSYPLDTYFLKQTITSPHSDGCTILIIDDQLENRILLKNMLTPRGHRILQAEDSQQALRMATANPPDLILLDVKMPGMDGFELCQIFKIREDLKAIPVIFITALSDLMDKVRAFALGGVDYIVKPFEPQEVLARINNHIAIRFRHQQLEKHIEQLELSQTTAPSHLPSAVSGLGQISLTAREEECLVWLARGLRLELIAHKLQIKPVTVDLHLTNARKKLSATTRSQAMSIAIQMGLIKP
jgi:DNA-binding response OmpR family regulator